MLVTVPSWRAGVEPACHTVKRAFPVTRVSFHAAASMMVLASGTRRRINIRTTSAIKYTMPLGGKVPQPFAPGWPGLTPGNAGLFVESVCSDRAMLRVHKSLQSSRVPPHSENTARDACRVALVSGLSCRDSNRHDRFVLGRLPLTPFPVYRASADCGRWRFRAEQRPCPLVLFAGRRPRRWGAATSAFTF